MNDKTKLVIAVIIIAIIIGAASYNHTLQQERKAAGHLFGELVIDIQETLVIMQNSLVLQTHSWESGDISNTGILAYYDEHVMRMDTVIARYDSLVVPLGFDGAVALLKLSAQSQRDSDAEFALWLRSGNIENKLRSDELLQDSFEYESEGLAAFAAAKLGLK